MSAPRLTDSPLGIQRIWKRIDERVRFGIKPGLQRMERLLELLNHPERQFRVIHVAGTNGKGTLCSFVEQGLRQAGLRTGLYTSPHLLSPLERILVDGQPLDELALAVAWHRLEPLIDQVQPSYFELLTALALLAFRNAGVELAVVECGLGGRWDATNVLNSELAVLTSVGLDHTAILGDSLAAIARDKAGIARPACPFLLGELEAEARDAALEVANSRGAVAVTPEEDHPLLRYQPADGEGRVCITDGDLAMELDHPSRGALFAAGMALRILRRLPEARFLREGIHLRPAPLPGRFQVLHNAPPLVLDVAHNPAAITLLAKDLDQHWPNTRWTLIFAAMADKDYRTILRILAPRVASMRPLVLSHARLASPEDLLEAGRAAGIRCGRPLGRAGLAARRLDTPHEPTLVCGSFLTVAAWLGANDRNLPPGL